MKFLFSFLIFFITIISNRLFLLNEEFLILVSFISFVFFCYNKFSSNINFYFKEKSLHIEKTLINSLNSIINKLIQKKKLNNKTKKLKTTFFLLKNYYLMFSSKFFSNFLVYLKNKEKNSLLNNLEILKRLETDYTKFILLLVSEKLNLISNLLFFFNCKLQIKQFKLIGKINRLTLFKKI